MRKQLLAVGLLAACSSGPSPKPGAAPMNPQDRGEVW
jgi:hypothetical protein